jgi:two-component system, NtrC family, response regulator AtoC
MDGADAHEAYDAPVQLGSARLRLDRADREPAAIRLADPTEPSGNEPVVHDPTMRQLHAMMDLFAPTPLNVLVIGEPGVGKQVYAGAIHARSGRNARPYREIRCGALPEAALEAELFGYAPGADPDLIEGRPGVFETAAGGTVVLREISELPLTTQAKLVRVLESNAVVRLSGVTAAPIEVRFVATTSRNLRMLVAERKFRADLYFRINGITIMLPPLRDRRPDIAPLARAFAQRAAATLGREAPTLTSDAIAALERHAWPGNVRELESVIERATAWCAGDVLSRAELERVDRAFAPRRTRESALFDLPATDAAASGAVVDELRALGRRRILDALAESAGNQTRAARALGISRFQLMRRLEALGVPRPRKTTPHTPTTP